MVSDLPRYQDPLLLAEEQKYHEEGSWCVLRQCRSSEGMPLVCVVMQVVSDLPSSRDHLLLVRSIHATKSDWVCMQAMECLIWTSQYATLCYGAKFERHKVHAKPGQRHLFTQVVK